MTYKVAEKLNETFVLDKNFELVLLNKKTKIEDPLCKGYIYANMFFYDEVQKEIAKLQKLVQKIHDEIILELGIDPNDPVKLLMELSVRVNNAIGSDNLDAMIKEFLSKKTKHIVLMIDENEKSKLTQICEAILMELLTAFFDMTVNNARDMEGGIKTFRFSAEYINQMTDRQKRLLSPALKMIGFENQIKLSNFELGQDWSVKYIPERLPEPFMKKEEFIKDQIKSFIQKNQ